MMLVALLLAAATSDVAPTGGSLALFAEPFYRGNTARYSEDQGDIRLDFRPRSVKAKGRWLACSEPRFKGRCVELESNYPVDAALGMSFNIRSLRELTAGGGAALPPPGMAPGGQSLTGANARFYPAPAYGSERALACPNGAPDIKCAKRTAEDLCRRASYRKAEHFALQGERGLYYLADVLCSRP